jgi:hypothetical protein
MLILLLASISTSAFSQVPGVFQVGVATSDITPDSQEIASKKIYLGGYLLQRARGVGDPIFARSLVISEENGEGTFVFSALDLPGISNISIQRIQIQASEQTGIPADRILIGCTHSHSAPDLQGLYGGVSSSYRTFLENRTVDSIVAAARTQRPSEVFLSKGRGHSRNRRGWNFTDDEFTVVDFRDSINGGRIATLVNFAAHPLTRVKDKLVSRDFPGVVVDQLERQLGGTALYANGIVGDVLPTKIQKGTAYSQEYGSALAASMISSMANQTRVSSSTIYFATHSWAQQVRNAIFKLAFRLKVLKYFVRFIDRKPHLDTAVNYFKLGEELEAVTSPGESTTRNGLPVKEAMTAQHRLFLGLTGNTLGYFVPTDEWKKGRHHNYEEMISIDRGMGDRVRDSLITLIKDQSK